MLALIALLVAATPQPLGRGMVARPRIEAWVSRADGLYSRGENVRVYFRTDEDAYVTLLRVDTDGRVRVLFPREPWEDNFARGQREYEVQSFSSRDAFRVDDDPGIGYVFAVAAADPFAYGPIASGDHWDYRVIADGRVRGDPYVALTELVERMVPAGYADWDYDLIPYYVERHYDYPRFVCYDCHAYASWVHWNPYHTSCVSFRIVIHDDPWYYPYRYRHGTRVVVVRPSRPAPRFVFKERDAGPFVTRVRERPVNDETRRGTRGRDVGGVGSVPAPVGPRPRAEAGGDADRRRSPLSAGRPNVSGTSDSQQPSDAARRDRAAWESRNEPDQPDRRGAPRQDGDSRDRLDRRQGADRPDRENHSEQPEGRSTDAGRREAPQRPAAPAPENRTGRLDRWPATPSDRRSETSRDDSRGEAGRTGSREAARPQAPSDRRSEASRDDSRGEARRTESREAARSPAPSDRHSEASRDDSRGEARRTESREAARPPAPAGEPKLRRRPS